MNGEQQSNPSSERVSFHRKSIVFGQGNFHCFKICENNKKSPQPKNPPKTKLVSNLKIRTSAKRKTLHKRAWLRSMPQVLKAAHRMRKTKQQRLQLTQISKRYWWVFLGNKYVLKVCCPCSVLQQQYPANISITNKKWKFWFGFQKKPTRKNNQQANRRFGTEDLKLVN